MSLKYNYQIFLNVATIEDLLGNIKLVAASNGWVVDKDDIAANQELYLHNLGNGSQNLYFSLKGVVTSTYGKTNNATRIVVCGNTGFDINSAYNVQPGYFSTNEFDTIVQFPITNQYVLANGTNLLSVFDYNLAVAYFAKRFLTHIFMGSIDSYKVAETEGNLCSSGSYMKGNYNGDQWMDAYFNLFGNAQYVNSINVPPDPLFSSGLLYNTLGQQTSANVGIIENVAIYSNSNSNYVYDINIVVNGQQYPDYSAMVKYNTTVSRTTLIKPIIYLNYSDATDTYDYPIGELPYYACKAYPYSKAGDIIKAGTRNFMVFPLLQYTDANGVAFEVN